MSEQLRKPVITSGKLAEGIKLMLIGFAEKLFCRILCMRCGST